jgi:hypothetical protein
MHSNVLYVYKPCTKFQNSGWLDYPQRQCIVQQTPTSLTSFGGYEVLLSSCKNLNKVCYLFYEKIYVKQKVALFVGNDPSFFSKSGVWKKWQVFGFLNWRMSWTHGACVDSVKGKVIKSKSEIYPFITFNTQWNPLLYAKFKSKQSNQNRATAFHRSSLTLRIKTVVMEMVSSKFYWLKFKLYGGWGSCAGLGMTNLV